MNIYIYIYLKYIHDETTSSDEIFQINDYIQLAVLLCKYFKDVPLVLC